MQIRYKLADISYLSETQKITFNSKIKYVLHFVMEFFFYFFMVGVHL